jgi:hypothetical protein
MLTGDVGRAMEAILSGHYTRAIVVLKCIEQAWMTHKQFLGPPLSTDIERGSKFLKPTIRKYVVCPVNMHYSTSHQLLGIGPRSMPLQGS